MTKFSKQQAIDLHRKAHEAGMAAMAKVTPTPMAWGKPSTPLGTDLAVVQGVSYEGPCGFASVRFPANTSFARESIKAGVAKKAQHGPGAYVWVREGGQSYEKKSAYAGAYAAVLREAGVAKVYAESRMD